MVVNRFDIYLIELDPTIGSEIKKTRPCVIVSPNEMNCLKTVLIAPMTTKGFHALRDRSRVVPRSDKACVFTKRSVVKMQAL